MKDKLIVVVNRPEKTQTETEEILSAAINKEILTQTLDKNI
jgi:hypothetical protein